MRLIDADALWLDIDIEDHSVYEVAVAVMDSVTTAPTIDAVPVSDLKEFAEDVAYQFGYKIGYNGRLHIGTGGLSTLEWAFDILGWNDPHPYPEGECEWEGCHEYATGGTPTAEGYRRLCGKHFAEIWKRRVNDERTV